MYINSSNSYIEPSYNQQKRVNQVEGGNSLPVSDQSDRVSISQSAKDYPAQGEKIGPASLGDSAWVTGKELVIKFGSMALGGEQQIADWKDKGMEIPYETIEAAFNALQEGFKQLGAGRGAVSVNRHEIVKNTQSVPDWFEQEYENSLASIQDPGIKKAFEQGELFYATPLTTTASKALSAYMNG